MADFDPPGGGSSPWTDTGSALTPSGDETIGDGTDDADLESLSAAEENGVSVAGDGADIGADISTAISNSQSLFVPPDVSQSFMTLSGPVDETPPDGWTLDVAERAPSIDATAVSGTAIDLSGSENASTSITSNVSVGDTTISVNSASGFTDGQLVMIRSDESFNPSRTAYTKGEMNRVASISTGQITVEWGVFDSYDSTQNARAVPLDAPKDVRLRNVEVFGSGSTNQGINLSATENLTVDNPTVSDFSDAGITFSTSFYATVITPRAQDVIGGVGYGLNTGGGAIGSHIIGGHAERCRSGFSLTGSGVCRLISFVNPTAIDCSVRGVGTHAGAEGVTITNPTALRCRTAGVYVRSPSTTVTGGYLAFCDDGLGTAEGGGLNLTVSGVECAHNTGKGISLGSGSGNGYRQGVSIRANVHHNDGEGLLFGAASTGFEDIRVRGLYRHNGAEGVRLTDVDDIDVDVTSTHNERGLWIYSTSGGGGSVGRVSGLYTQNDLEGILRDDAKYSSHLFDSITALNNDQSGAGASDVNVTAGSSDLFGDVLD